MTITTTETAADRYRRLAGRLTDKVAAVPENRWDSPSPCEGWSAREVLRHVVDSEIQFLGRVGVDVPEGPSVDTEPAAAWRHTRDAVQKVLDDPTTADLQYETAMGTSTVATAFSTFYGIDLVVHGWDIAHATGIDATIPPEDVAMTHDFVKDAGDMLRSPNGFGPAITVPSDADDQTKLLAFLGRR